MRLLHVVCCLLISNMVARAEREPAQELKYRIEGNDLIVSTEITLIGSPHLLLTSIDRTEQSPPVLRYSIIQNADHRYESLKYVNIEWRLKNHNTDDRPTRVVSAVLSLTTDELKQLGGKALELVKD